MSYRKIIEESLRRNDGKLDLTELQKIINKCIISLELAQKYMSLYKSSIKDEKNLTDNQKDQFKSTALQKMISSQLVTENGDLIAEAFGIKRKEISKINEEKLKQQTEKYLRDGYTLINELAEILMNRPIEYTIMVSGKVGTDDVLATSTLTMDKILSESSLEFSAQGGIGLKITSSANEIKKALSELGTEQKKKRGIFSNLTKVKLEDSQQTMWSKFIQIGQKARENKVNGKIKNYGLNFGVISESFWRAYRKNEKSLTHQEYYNYLQEGRNNLAYWKGPDVTFTDGNKQTRYEQVKSLTAYTDTSRFDVATLSNVLKPLQKLQTYFSIDSGSMTQEAFIKKLQEEMFSPKDKNEGERKWKDAIADEVHGFLDEILSRGIQA